MFQEIVLDNHLDIITFRHRNCAAEAHRGDSLLGTVDARCVGGRGGADVLLVDNQIYTDATVVQVSL